MNSHRKIKALRRVSLVLLRVCPLRSTIYIADALIIIETQENKHICVLLVFYVIDFIAFIVFLTSLGRLMSIAQFEELSLTLGIGGLVLLMIFILYQLCKESNAGGFGTFVIFFALAMGVFGFAVKSVIRLFLPV